MPPDASAPEIIDRNCILARHQAAFDIVAHACGRALPRVADSGAAWCHHDEPILRRHALKALAAQLPSGLQSDIAGLAVTAAIAAARRMIDAVERRQNIERRIDAAADLDDLAEAAAGAAGTAGIRPQLLAPEDQRRLRLRDLDRRAAHAAGIGGGGQSVLGEARAGAAIAGHRHRESVIAAGTAAGLAPDIEIPQTRGADRKSTLLNSSHS